MFSKQFRKRAFTLMELVVVLVVIAILMAGLAFYGSNNIKRTRVQTTETFLRVLATDMEAAFDDYGPYINNTLLDEAVREQKIKTFCITIGEDYMHTALDIDSVQIYENGFSVKTSEVDPWGTPYEIYYIMVSEKEGNFIAMSNGPDMVSNRKHYIDGKFADDIVLSAVMHQ